MARLTDASGVTLELARPPRRIVSLIPSTTELLCHLGLGDALVGITVYCVEPRDVVRGKIRIGGEKNPDLEKIRALEPDLVVANVEENVREHIETLRSWDIPVWVTYPRTVAEGLTLIADLGALTGAEARARAVLDELEPLYQKVRAAAAKLPPVSVFYPIWREPWMTVGGDTYIHDMLGTCGGINVFGDRARYPTVTLAEVAARRPDVILLPDEPFRFRLAHVRDFDPFPDVPAVSARRIHLVDGKLFSWHGPRAAAALRAIPPLLRH